MIELRLKEANTLKKKKSLAYEINKVVEWKAPIFFTKSNPNSQ